MARIEATTHIEAPIERVWEVLLDWEDQPRWMVDARSVEVISDHREGTGVVLRCATDIAAGIVVTDDIEITEWIEHELIGVHHLGRIIRGVGAFEMTVTPWGVHLTWWEEVDAPLGGLGESLATLVVVPYVRRVFRSSLAGLKRVCESQSVRP